MKTCSSCGEPLRSNNATGFCQRTKACKNASERARKAKRAPECQCLGCGKDILPNHNKPVTTYTCGKGKCWQLGRDIGILLKGLEKNERALAKAG